MTQAHVFYFLAGTLGESAAHPNVFSIKNPSSSNPILSEVVASFPLDRSFHFCFKTKVKDFGYIWMDVNDPDSVVPKFGSSIFAKVLQLDKVRYSGISRGRLESGVKTSTNVNSSKSKSRSSSNSSNSYNQQHRQPSRQQSKSRQSSKPSITTTTSSSNNNHRSSSAPIASTSTSSTSRLERSDSDDMFSFGSGNKTASKPIVDSLPNIAPSDVKNALGRLATGKIIVL
jgi:hypothetical protein